MPTVAKAPPNSADALREELSTPEKAAQIFSDPGRRDAWLKGYYEESKKSDPELQEQLAESKDRGFKAFLEAN
mgnify:FL=1